MRGREIVLAYLLAFGVLWLTRTAYARGYEDGAGREELEACIVAAERAAVELGEADRLLERLLVPRWKAAPRHGTLPVATDRVGDEPEEEG